MSDGPREDALGRTLKTIQRKIHEVLLAAPTFTGKIEINLKDGTAKDLTMTQRMRFIE